MAKWAFYDGYSLQDYIFEINPSEGGSPQFTKNIAQQSTAAPDGKTLLFEGRDSPQTIEFSGTLLTEDQYNAFVTWYQKRRQIRITDDLGREFWVYITSFAPRRERAIHYPWKHSYTVSATILDWE